MFSFLFERTSSHHTEINNLIIRKKNKNHSPNLSGSGHRSLPGLRWKTMIRSSGGFIRTILTGIVFNTIKLGEKARHQYDTISHTWRASSVDSFSPFSPKEQSKHHYFFFFFCPFQLKIFGLNRNLRKDLKMNIPEYKRKKATTTIAKWNRELTNQERQDFHKAGGFSPDRWENIKVYLDFSFFLCWNFVFGLLIKKDVIFVGNYVWRVYIHYSPLQQN